MFFATPHGVAQELIPSILQAGIRVIDLSADFRLRDIPLWEKWYGQDHGAPELVAKAVYGLPETNREAIKMHSLLPVRGVIPPVFS